MTSLYDFNNRVMSSWIAQHVAEEKKIPLEEARKYISGLSFSEYVKLSEVVIPPSGQTIAPSQNAQNSPQAPMGANKMKSIWPGNGAPIEKGMTVGVKGPNGMPVPGEVTQVDMGAKGVKIKNPTTGQEEWQNQATLEPFMAKGETPGQPQQSVEEAELNRLAQLAGIKENCSAGATGAGAIAVSPAAMGKVKRRQPTEEQKTEYTPRGPAKTLIGDTKPNQASGLLSATLAANGKKTASRKNNGIKK